MTKKFDGTFRLNLISDDGDELNLMLPTGASGIDRDDVKMRPRHPVRESL